MLRACEALARALRVAMVYAVAICIWLLAAALAAAVVLALGPVIMVFAALFGLLAVFLLVGWR